MLKKVNFKIKRYVELIVQKKLLLMKQNCGYTIVCTEVFFVITASVKAKYNDGGKNMLVVRQQL